MLDPPQKGEASAAHRTLRSGGSAADQAGNIGASLPYTPVRVYWAVLAWLERICSEQGGGLRLLASAKVNQGPSSEVHQAKS